MNVDLYDNRVSTKLLKGDIMDVTMLEDDGSRSGYPHVCVTLNTGYNLLLERDALEMINRRVKELE